MTNAATMTTCGHCGAALPNPRHFRGDVPLCGEDFANRTAAELDK